MRCRSARRGMDQVVDDRVERESGRPAGRAPQLGRVADEHRNLGRAHQRGVGAQYRIDADASKHALRQRRRRPRRPRSRRCRPRPPCRARSDRRTPARRPRTCRKSRTGVVLPSGSVRPPPERSASARHTSAGKDEAIGLPGPLWLKLRVADDANARRPVRLERDVLLRCLRRRVHRVRSLLRRLGERHLALGVPPVLLAAADDQHDRIERACGPPCLDGGQQPRRADHVDLERRSRDRPAPPARTRRRPDAESRQAARRPGPAPGRRRCAHRRRASALPAMCR